jgi:nitrogenase molybdenum-iron protein beta chain
MAQIVATAQSEGLIPEGCTVLTASTPSYSGSHVTGFATMTASMASLGEAGPKQRPGQVNVIPGWVEPADVAEIKRIFSSFGLAAIVFPDVSYLTERVVEPNRASSGGGVQVDALRRSGTSELTFALGPTASLAAAKSLEQSCAVPVEPFELPIGLRATDALVHRLHCLTGRPVPEQLQHDRYRLVILLKRMNQYLYGKRVALFGDPDQLVSLSGFLADAGMKPVFVVSGTPGKNLATRVGTVLEGRSPEVRIAQGAQADLFTLHQWIKQQPVDLLVGNSYGKYIARDEGIPLVRASFPIFDRTSHHYFPMVGYRGGQYLTDQLINALLDQLDRDCPEEAMELVR